MNKISILDCTLRDGGYVNNWNFGRNIIENIVKNLGNARIDIIEIGFLTDKKHTENDSLFTTTDELKLIANQKGNRMIAGMIALGEKEIDANKLALAKETGVDIIRITFHHDETEIDKAVSFAQILHEKGYKVCMQPVGTTSYSDNELKELIKKINALKPFAFYLVDTLGTLYKDKLMHFINLIDENLDKSIKLGFHSHNNLQMSFSNAQLIVEHNTDREFILDSSLYGMGRGAGNLNTELITRFINEINGSVYDLVPILDLIDSFIYPLSLKYAWGYNAHYYMSAIHNCHPNYSAYLMNMQTLTMNEVNLILQNLPKKSRHVFNKGIIEKIYINFQKAMGTIVDDKIKDLDVNNILVLAPGKTVERYKKEIFDYIKQNNPLVFSINFIPDDINVDYVFLSNRKRLLSFDYDKANTNIIITSNLPKLTDEFICVDYDSLCDDRYAQPDNAGMMLLRFLSNKGCKRVALAGFDGFRTEENYSVKDGTISGFYTEDVAYEKNEAISKQLVDIKTHMALDFLTPSAYKDIIDE